jgi:hypothetical protein
MSVCCLKDLPQSEWHWYCAPEVLACRLRSTLRVSSESSTAAASAVATKATSVSAETISYYPEMRWLVGM